MSENGEQEFSATRQLPPNTHGSIYRVKYCLLGHDHILIIDRRNHPERCMVLTLTLKDEVQRRFVIAGKGE